MRVESAKSSSLQSPGGGRYHTGSASVANRTRYIGFVTWTRRTMSLREQRKTAAEHFIDFFIFILLSLESDGGAVRMTNPTRFFNLLLLDFTKQRWLLWSILSKDAITELGWELNYQPCDHGRRQNEAPNHSATLPTNLVLHIVWLLPSSYASHSFIQEVENWMRLASNPRLMHETVTSTGANSLRNISTNLDQTCLPCWTIP